MFLKTLILFFISLTIGLSSFGQNEPDQTLPPLEMLPTDGEIKYIHSLPYESSYQIYDVKGMSYDSGYGQFIDYTEYEPGEYFVHYDGGIENFTRKGEVGISNAALLKIVIGAIIIILAILLFFGFHLRRVSKERSKLIETIHDLNKSIRTTETLVDSNQATLDKQKIEAKFPDKLNESDWKIIDQLSAHPSISNKDLADRVSLSVEGTRSALKKMYRIFEIPSSRNMRLTLVIKLMEISRAH